MPARTSRSINWPLLGITALAAAVSIGVGRGIAPDPPDSAEYMRGAESLLAGKGLLDIEGGPQVLFPPGYPFAVSLLARCTGDIEPAGRLVSLIASTLCIPLLYMLALRLVGAPAALVASALFALLPLRVTMSTTIWSDSLYMLLVLGAMLAVLKSRLGRILWWLGLAALLCGAAYLVRPEGLIAFAILALGVALAAESRRLALGRVALMLAVLAVFVIPYASYLHRHTGKWQLSAKADYNLTVAASVGQSMTFSQMRHLNLEGTELIRLEPQRGLKAFCVRIIRNQALLWHGLCTSVTTGVLIFALIALPPLWQRHRDSPLHLCVMAILVLPMLYLSIFFVLKRFLLSMCTFAILAGACGAQTATVPGQDAVEKSGRRTISIFSILLLACYALLMTGPLSRAWLHPEPRTNKQIGLWIRENVVGGDVVMTRRQQVAYYAGRHFHHLPYESLPRISAYARLKGIKLILLERGVPEDVPPEVDDCVRMRAERFGLRKLKVWHDFMLVTPYEYGFGSMPYIYKKEGIPFL